MLECLFDIMKLRVIGLGQLSAGWTRNSARNTHALLLTVCPLWNAFCLSHQTIRLQLTTCYYYYLTWHVTEHLALVSCPPRLALIPVLKHSLWRHHTHVDRFPVSVQWLNQQSIQFRIQLVSCQRYTIQWLLSSITDKHTQHGCRSIINQSINQSINQ